MGMHESADLGAFHVLSQGNLVFFIAIHIK